MKKKRMFYLIAILALFAVSVMFFFITRVATPDHTYSKIDLIKGGESLPNKGGGSYPKSDVDWVHGGGSLPHPAHPDGESHPRPDPEHYQAGSGNHEGNASGHPSPPKPAGTPYRGHPHVVWNGDGLIRPEEGYNWENQKDPGASKYRAVPLPLGTPYRDYLHVVWAGDGQNVMAAKGYKWATNDPVADNYGVVPLTTEEKVWVYGSNATSAVKDKVIRDWIVKVPCKFLNDSGQKKQLSPWVGDGYLIFTETFLTETPAVRENLIAFESGKLFFTMMKDKPVKDGKTLETWFYGYSGRYNSTISNMRWAKHQNEDLSMIIDLPDYPSEFGYIFRAQALQLDKPKDKKARQEWDKALREFQTYVNPLFQQTLITVFRNKALVDIHLLGQFVI